MAAALLLYAGLAADALRRDAPTFDEVAHLSSGWTHLVYGDYRMVTDAPLVRQIAALPLLLDDVQMKLDDEAWRLRRPWEFGKRWLYRWNDADRLMRLGRLPIVVLGAVLVLAIYLWARRRFGRATALWALPLAALSPDFIAHGHLVTLDVGAALFIFLALVAGEAALRRLSWRRILIAGAALGAALAAKYSALVLLPVLGLLALATVLAPEPLRVERGYGERLLARRGARALALLGASAVVALAALATLWAAYGLRDRVAIDPEVEAALPWQRLEPESPILAAATDAARATHVVPEAWLHGFLRFFAHSEARPSFLLGRRSDTGFPQFFLVTFLVKTPVGLLLLLAVAVALWRRQRAGWRDELALWLPVAVFAALTLTRGLNIGHRHLLPIYPFLIVAGGRAAAWLAASGRGGRAAAAALVGWAALSVLAVHPQELAYFNELVGGPPNGYRVLVDSSLDWGQDLTRLGPWARDHGVERLKLSYFGTADPEYYHLPAKLLPGHMLPRPARVVTVVRPGDIVAVSATNLQCVYLEPGPCGLMRLLREREPIGRVGWSILVYRADFAWTLP